MIGDYRRAWNKQQAQVRRLLADSSRFEEARSLFLSHHGELHTREVHPAGSWSYEDEIFSDLTNIQTRAILKKEGHSIAWLIWHLARIEDVTMNLLIADRDQIFNQGDWQAKMNVRYIDTGNAMTPAEITALSANIDIPALRAYRLAVGIGTRELVDGLDPDILMEKVQPVRLDRIRKEGAVVESASSLLDYWGRRDVTGILLMPATRHNFVHLNEAHKIKIKLQNS